MKELLGYGEVVSLLSPLFLFIIAVGFRLLDNSAHLFLQKEITVSSSYVSITTCGSRPETPQVLNLVKSRSE